MNGLQYTVPWKKGRPLMRYVPSRGWEMWWGFGWKTALSYEYLSYKEGLKKFNQYKLSYNRDLASYTDTWAEPVVEDLP